jgi:hypothetical protein
MLALILQAVQGGNWQRSGGKGKPPEPISRPSDTPITVTTAEQLAARRAAQNAELARRRKQKQRQLKDS